MDQLSFNTREEALVYAKDCISKGFRCALIDCRTWFIVEIWEPKSVWIKEA